MEVHVDQVEVEEPAARPEWAHAHVQVLYPVGGQHKDALGVRLQEQEKRSGSDGAPLPCSPGAQGSPSCPRATCAEGARGLRKVRGA